MHLFYNASQIIKMVILVDLSAIFLASPLSLLAWEFSKWHGFPQLLSPFQGSNRFVALLPQSENTSQYHNEYRTPSSFLTTLPVKFHQLPMNLAVYSVNRIFLEGFYHGWSDHQEIHPPSFHLFQTDTLQMPRTIFSQRNTRNWYIDTRHTDLRHFDSPGNSCAANWLPCFKDSSSHAKCSRM